MGEITDLYEEFVQRAGMPREAEWLGPPVTDAQVAFTEEALGIDLPPDLRELLSIHNGDHLFDSYVWNPCSASTEGGLVWGASFLPELLEDMDSYGALEHLRPGPRTLYLAWESQVAFLYDLDEVPGRLLYLDVRSFVEGHGVIPLARDLVTLVGCYVALAEAGFVTVNDRGPWVIGPEDEVKEIYVQHRVAHAPISGMIGWLSWPGSAEFSID